MGNAIILIGLLWLSLILGFAYIIWAKANKQEGTVKILGWILAIFISILALFIFVFMSMSAGRIAHKGCPMMMNREGMHRMDMKDMRDMKDMKRMNPDAPKNMLDMEKKHKRRMK